MRSRNIPYIAKLDHLRFFAALLVIVYHYYHFKTHFYNGGKSPHVISSSPLSAFIIEGHTGVSLFLVLSGFIFAVIAWSKELSYGEFIRNRLLRIMPLYATVLAVACLISKSSLAQLLASLTFTAGLVPGVDDIRITPHLWTIALEFQFYLLFPFLIQFMQQQGLRYAIGLIGLCIAIRLLLWGLGDLKDLKTLVYNSLLGRMDQFVIGMAAGIGYQSGALARRFPWLKRAWSPVVGAALAILSIWAFHRSGGLFRTGDKSLLWVVWTTWEGAVWALVILTYCLSRFELPARASRSLAFLGTLSFSLYVNHWFFVNTTPWQKWVPKLVSNFPMNALVSACLFVLPGLIVFSWLTYRVIEKPFFDLRRPYLRRKETAPVLDAPPPGA